MSAKLLCRTGPQAGLTFRIRDVARIGRGSGIEVDLPLQGVSSLHATILFTTGSYWIEDAGSTNGTFVNGRRVTRERLRHLDVLSMGTGVDLVFVLKPAAAGQEQSVILGPALASARLVATDGPEAGAVRDIPKGVLTVGRATACNLVIDSAAVSKMHARLERMGDLLTVVDLGSANGTFVNGVKVSAAPLADGDRLVFAAVREFRVELEVVMGAGQATVSLPRVTAPGDSPSGVAQDWRTRYDFSPGENAPDAKGGKGEMLPRPAGGGSTAPKASAPKTPAAVPQPTQKPVESPKPQAPKAALPPVLPSPPALPAVAAPERDKDREGLTERIPHISQVVLESPIGTHRVGAGSHYVGRHVTCAIWIQETKISRLHATITVTANEVILKDLQSANGTYLNGERITEPKPLKSGDTIIFGEAPFKVNVEY